MRRPTALVTAVTLALLAACTGGDDSPRPEADPAVPAEPTSASSRLPEGPDYTLVGATYLTKPGWPGRWAMAAYGNPMAPLAVFDVPNRSQGHEVWIWFDFGRGEDRQFGQVMYSAPTRVPTDPCRPAATMQRVGPTPADLADALAAQRLTRTSVPTGVTLAGHRGLYLELTLPPRVVDDCRPGGAVIYQVADDESRVLDIPATDRYWILLVDGYRLVLTAMTDAGGAADAAKRVTDIVESVEFVAPPE